MVKKIIRKVEVPKRCGFPSAGSGKGQYPGLWFLALRDDDLFAGLGAAQQLGNTGACLRNGIRSG